MLKAKHKLQSKLKTILKLKDTLLQICTALPHESIAKV